MSGQTWADSEGLYRAGQPYDGLAERMEGLRSAVHETTAALDNTLGGDDASRAFQNVYRQGKEDYIEGLIGLRDQFRTTAQGLRSLANVHGRTEGQNFHLAQQFNQNLSNGGQNPTGSGTGAGADSRAYFADNRQQAIGDGGRAPDKVRRVAEDGGAPAVQRFSGVGGGEWVPDNGRRVSEAGEESVGSGSSAALPGPADQGVSRGALSQSGSSVIPAGPGVSTGPGEEHLTLSLPNVRIVPMRPTEADPSTTWTL